MNEWTQHDKLLIHYVKYLIFFGLMNFSVAASSQFHIWYDEDGVKHISNIPRKCIGSSNVVEINCNQGDSSVSSNYTTKQSTDLQQDIITSLMRLEEKYLEIQSTYQDALDTNRELAKIHNGKVVTPKVKDYFLKFERDQREIRDAVRDFELYINRYRSLYLTIKTNHAFNLQRQGANNTFGEYLFRHLRDLNRRVIPLLESLIQLYGGQMTLLKNVFFIQDIALQKAYEIKSEQLDTTLIEFDQSLRELRSIELDMDRI